MPRPVFLAAPDANQADLTLIDKLVLGLQVQSGGALKGSDIFSPHLQLGDVGVDADESTYFTRCMDALNECRVVVAVLDGAQVDDGVAFLVGLAFAAEKPVIGFRTDRRQAPHPLLEGAVSKVVFDLKGLSAALAKQLTA